MFNLDSVLCVDVETNDLHGYTKMHYVVCSDLHTGEEWVFEDVHKNLNAKASLRKLLSAYKTIAGHHFLAFDIRALRDLVGIQLDPSSILDTLVLSRLFNYGILGGHSIEAWGARVGVKKEGADITDWSVKTPLMLSRCKSDVQVVRKIILDKMWRFLTDPEWHQSIETEHWVARMCTIMSENGLPFDKERAEKLQRDLAGRVAIIDRIIQRDFPPRPVEVRQVNPRRTKAGTLNQQDFRWARVREFTKEGDRVTLGAYIPERIPDLSMFDGSPFTLYEMEEFNPGSPRQMVTVLNEAGWKPTEKTDGHKKALRDRKKWKEKQAYYEEFGWKVSEENLKTLPPGAPAATKALAERLILASRLSDLEEWLALLQPDGKIHPNFNSIGAWTHRMSHNNPNCANIPVGGPEEEWMTDFQKYINDVNNQMRACFVAPKGWRQVGTDADGIQMRIFCHLVKDERLREAILTGSKDDETDIHSLHRKFLGPVCRTRDNAKTFIYGWLLGAGIGQVATILECTQREAKTAVANFITSYPGLNEFKNSQIPKDASRGYFIGLDGRKVACDSEHHMLAGYLQNGEKVIMARTAKIWMEKAEAEGIPYLLVNFVHDEWQVFVPDDDEICKRFQQIQLDAFVQCGEELDLFLPLAGSSDWGYNWKETH